jgi:hypothetical protein
VKSVYTSDGGASEAPVPAFAECDDEMVHE